ncbi:MAG: hypothetical protein E5299_01295 [Burkholderia gladioli]|nr:MAG: hypothetical protein E5299_01295 [Burkholderia gladioli]
MQQWPHVACFGVDVAVFGDAIDLCVARESSRAIWPGRHREMDFTLRAPLRVAMLMKSLPFAFAALLHKSSKRR